MHTAKLIFISIAILTILPLVAFNYKRMTIKKEGEKPCPNIRAIVLVSISSVILGLFILSLYIFTINYQPHLVLERFMNSYASVISGKIDQEKFFNEIGDIAGPELNSGNDKLMEMIRSDYIVIDTMVEGNSVRFQLGEIIIPRHYLNTDAFRQIEGVKEVILLGFSMGGAIAAYVSARRNDISKLLLWAPARNIIEIIKRNYENAPKLANGDADLGSYPLSLDMYQSLSKYDVMEGIEKYINPVLIIHGKKDLAVNYGYSYEYLEKYKNVSLYLIESAGHGFDKRNEKEELLKKSMEFVRG